MVWPMEYLQDVQETLMQEGFKATALQTIKPGQVFGLVRKQENVWQMHVRGFTDGSLASEIEIANDYFEHWDNNYRRDATNELIEILESYGIPYHSSGSFPHMEFYLEPPPKLTPWKPVVACLTLAGFLIWLGRGTNKS